MTLPRGCVLLVLILTASEIEKLEDSNEKSTSLCRGLMSVPVDTWRNLSYQLIKIHRLL